MPPLTPTDPADPYQRPTVTVYVSIGNSDDKLTQRQWSAFVLHTHLTISDAAATVHGAWYSGPAVEWQNACWCADIHTDQVPALKDTLRTLAGEFRQDSIAWAEVPATEFLTAQAPAMTEPGCTHPACTLTHPHAGPTVLATPAPLTPR